MRIVYQLIAGISVILLILTLIPCLICYGAVNFSTFAETVTLTYTSPLLLLWVLILILLLILAVRLFYTGTTTSQERRQRFTASLVLLLALEAFLCIFWQTHYDNAPLADQRQVWNAAVAIAQGTSLDNASYFILLPRQKAMALCFAVQAGALSGQTSNVRLNHQSEKSSHASNLKPWAKSACPAVASMSAVRSSRLNPTHDFFRV